MSAIEPLESALALEPHARFLPPVAAHGYRVGDAETLAAALHRLTTEQFTIAIDSLTEPGDDVAGAATAALDSMHRIVAVLALVRRVIGDEAYRTEVMFIGDTATRLETFLTGSGALTALGRLRARFDAVLRPDTFADLQGALEQRHMVARFHALSGAETIDATLHSLRRARARFAAWPIEGDTARMYGREPIPDIFASIEPGLRSTYKQARRDWLELRDTGTLTDPRSWSTKACQLGYHLSLMATIWPEVVDATATSCNHLADALREAGQLAELRRVVFDDRALCPDPTERALLGALVLGASRELEQVASVIGARIFVEPTKQFITRLSAYWDTRDLLR